MNLYVILHFLQTASGAISAIQAVLLRDFYTHIRDSIHLSFLFTERNSQV